MNEPLSTAVSVSREIAASPDAVWALVADVTQMRKWSPETTGCDWVGDADGPAVGASFKGRNAHGKKSWSTAAKVTDCEPGSMFVFEVKAGGMKIARWEYTLKASETGCRVTESWTDHRSWLARNVPTRVTGVSDRAARNKETIQETLDRLAEGAKSAGS